MTGTDDFFRESPCLQFFTTSLACSATAAEPSFERRWALTLLEAVLKRLQAEYEAEDKAKLFAALNPCLVGERTSQPYAELATQLGLLRRV